MDNPTIEIDENDPWEMVTIAVRGPDCTIFTVGNLPAEPGTYELVKVEEKRTNARVIDADECKSDWGTTDD